MLPRDELPERSRASMFIFATSLTMRAIFLLLVVSTWERRVVFPLPRKPARVVTGIGFGDAERRVFAVASDDDRGRKEEPERLSLFLL